MRKVIKTKLAPEPTGPYAQGVLAGNFLFSTQMGICPATGELAGNDAESQTKQAMKNLKNILLEAEMNLADIGKMTIYIKDMNDHLPQVNQVCRSYFKEAPPVIDTIAATDLPIGGLVMIDIVAHKHQ
ncbi:Rid family detoxifying hydrolase [Acetonema longum]|uniref:Endoribonuclease L-PSP n=1 Tax=Acetonema longum DSM 6540 TaxID=1009370 RepID=F7NKL8_9FIRM|nr:Rid family detoxifying hydrolase [Acetonema longum]EGO63426.1 endoribonuclease L-PSP [Acetonema longum DSM 6540]